jgi:hypothetical protein
MKCLVACAVLGIGCSSSEPKSKETSATPVVKNVAEPSTPADAARAATLPAELAEIVPKSTLQLGPFAWPKGGTSAIVTTNDSDRSTLVWKIGGASGQINMPRGSARTVLRDLTKDGEPELVVFSKPPATPLEWFDDQTMTWIVGVAPNKQPARMWRLEAQVLGATDDASLDRELAATSLGASTDSSPVKLIARLPLATPAELQALVGTSGLKLCHRGKKRKCSPLAQKKIDVKAAAKIVALGGEIATYGLDDQEAESLQVPACEVDEKSPTRLNCIASVGGPAGGEWVFDKTASGLRLAEVGSWAEEM